MGTEKQSWSQRDKDCLWHPFTQMQDWLNEDPLVIERAEQFELIDTEGKRYIDGHSSLWLNVHGHGHPRLVQAVAEQAARLDHSTLLGLANTPSIQLAEALCEVAPAGLTRVFYSDSGSTAVEIALKMSFQYWRQNGQPQRTRFIAFDGAYHGDTLGSVSVGGMELFHEIFHPLLFQVLRAPFPYPYRSESHRDDAAGCTAHCLSAMEDLLQRHDGEVCAIVAEPGIQGANGMLMAEPGFLKSLEALAHKYDVHLIVDEVATGFGRTGAMFACDAENVQPDFMCLAKGITGGILPLAATLTTEKVFQGFFGRYEEFKTFFHGHSYTGNPIACAAALANLALFRDQDLIHAMQANIAAFATALAPLQDHPHVGEIRRRGWMTGIELVADKDSRSIWPAAEKVPQKVVEAARKRGAVIRPLGNVMILMPPPAIDATTVQRLVEITAAAIDEVTMQVDR